MEPLSANQKEVYLQQDQILFLLKKFPEFPFVLSGGTALARFYLHHRFSEDLDFFFEGIGLPFDKISQIMTYLKQSGIQTEFVGKTNKKYFIKVASYVVGNKTPIKVDFLEDPFSGMWNPSFKKNGSNLSFRVDHIDLIYYRKFFSIAEQYTKNGQIHRIKDLVDLYCLHHNYKKIENRILFYTSHSIPIDIEKIILSFSSVKLKEIKKQIKISHIDFNADELYNFIQITANQLVNLGMHQ